MQKYVLSTLLIFWVFRLDATVKSVEFTSKEVVLNGKNWGKTGSYELWKGRVTFSFDPVNKSNQNITDITLAEQNDEGQVEANANIVVLKPTDMSKASGVGLVEVSNRGRKFALSTFNLATAPLSAGDEEAFGDGLLMEQGLVLVWVGWQFDVPEQDDLLRLVVPVAKQKNKLPIQGFARSDWVVDDSTQVLGLGHHRQIPYPAISLTSQLHSLTRREGRDAPRINIPRSNWKFGKIDGDSLISSPNHIYMESGFEPGYIYELVYMVQDPPIVGLGLGAIRDIMSYMKYNDDCEFKVSYGIAAGTSQTGRFLRHFIYQGFNRDEYSNEVYDGMMIMTAGAGRGSFNHRFGQPSRDAHRYSAFFYPTDIFPFSSRSLKDSVSNSIDGLFQRTKDLNQNIKIFYVNTGYEYWGRSASLIHTDPYGSKDVQTYPNERIYHLASAQHYQQGIPQMNKNWEGGIIKGNPINLKVNYRSLLVSLVAWVKDNQPPPASRYPTIKNKTLVPLSSYTLPYIPGIKKPAVVHHPYRVEYGRGWGRGVISNQPPQVGAPFKVLVPQTDEFGNELGGIRNPEVEIPLATYTPWSFRGNIKSNPQELGNFVGYFIPLSVNKTNETVYLDSRPTLTQLYNSFDSYLHQVEAYTDSLIGDGYLLSRDKSRILTHCSNLWNFIFMNYHDNQNKNTITRGPEKGHLMIIGGGQVGSKIYQKIADLMGGFNMPLVVFPTAAGDNYLSEDPKFDRIKQRFSDAGFSDVTVLHTRSKEEANSEKFTRPITKARGIFFTGGRQWRLADSYLGTQTETEIKNLLNRGGVVAGSSAGATIQGSFLARGDTKTNTIMVGDHQEGFGLLSNSAIDQHVLARNRSFDMFTILEHDPTLLGISIDEGTALWVHQNVGQVIGTSYALFYDGKMWNQDKQMYIYNHPLDRKFYMLKAGQKYDLEKRIILKD